MTTETKSVLPTTPAEANDVRGSELRSIDGFGPNDLHRGSPLCVRQTYEMFCSELDRKQGMIDDLHQIANDNFGMTPEDCDLLTQTVSDRDNLRAALTAMRSLFD
jgi:hypothetical protein